jgi:hypothetical protein
MGDQTFAWPLPTHRTAETYNKHKTIHALLGFEPTAPVFERVKVVHALDRETNAIRVCEW